MKIAHVIFSMNTGGAELMVVDIMNHQIRQGHEVSLVIINNTFTQSILDNIVPEVNIVKLNRPAGSKNPLWLWRYNRLLSRLKADVYHFHHDKAVGMLKTRSRNAIYVGTVHATTIELAYYQKLDKIYSISAAVKEDIAARHGLDSAVIYNGVSTDRILPSIESYNHGKTFKIVQTGRVECEVKGQDILVDALAMLTNSGYDVTVDFIGAPIDQAILDKKAAQLGVESRLTFLGLKSRDYIYGHLKDYDLFIQPSRYEGFGLALVEAMAAKVPVVASDIDGPAEILDGNRYGRLFKNEDARACSEAIIDVIDHYPDYYRQAAAAAYERALQYSIANTARQYSDAYAELLKQKKH